MATRKRKVINLNKVRAKKLHTLYLPIQVTDKDIYTILDRAVNHGSVSWLQYINDVSTKEIITVDDLKKNKKIRPLFVTSFNADGYEGFKDNGYQAFLSYLPDSIIKGLTSFILKNQKGITKGRVDVSQLNNVDCDFVLQKALGIEVEYYC